MFTSIRRRWQRWHAGWQQSLTGLRIIRTLVIIAQREQQAARRARTRQRREES